jgi:hypothetical protein
MRKLCRGLLRDSGKEESLTRLDLAAYLPLWKRHVAECDASTVACFLLACTVGNRRRKIGGVREKNNKLTNN